MRFISPDFTDNTTDLYLQSNIKQTSIQEGNYFYSLSNEINTKDGGTLYNYLNDTVRKMLLSAISYDGVARTPASWLSNSGFTGTDHTSFSNTFDWNLTSIMQSKNGYFYTILAEDGVHFAKPERISTSKEIKSYEVISEITNKETDFSIQGETGFKFTLSDEKYNVTPILIDSAMKTARMNKYKSLQNVLTIQSGYNANPLDYIFRNGKYYIFMSRSQIKTDLYLYTAVLETKDTYSFSGADINNVTLSSVYDQGKKIVDYTTTADANEVTISGITKNPYDVFDIWICGQTDVSQYWGIYYNSDTTTTNYYTISHYGLYNGTNTVGTLFQSGIAYWLVNNNKVTHIILDAQGLQAATGDILFQSARGYTNNGDEFYTMYSYWNNNVARALITSLTFKFDGGSLFKSGTRILIYQRKA